MHKISFRTIGSIAALAFCFFTFSLHEACAESPLITHEKSIPARNAAGSSAGLENFSNAIIRIARDSIPAVVHIEVTESEIVESPALPFESDPFLKQFFDTPQMPKRFRRELKGIGTGMIINDGGFILTNYHVVESATQIHVALSDGREFPGRVIGSDPKTDLSVIRIEAKTKLPYVRFGDSDKVQVGEWVVAIGQPQGLNESVTQGIISAMHRQGIMDPNT
ncbi:MAG TPA: trypsin-like peptidase domain-containing protein, partial [Deltaproteobacteria bacterium]|nr:trypsin-like peptidase domain-containing protein [Deltaproteobacteria bacterium]